MSRYPKITSTEIREAKRLRREGKSYPQIAAALGRHHTSIYRALNPAAMRKHKASQAKRDERNRVTVPYRERYGDPSGHIVVSKPQSKIMAEKLMREIPEDNRDLTGRLCGDPLPGRSALDARRP